MILGVDREATSGEYSSSMFTDATYKQAGVYQLSGDICVVSVSGTYIAQQVFTTSAAGGVVRMPLYLVRISRDGGTNWSPWYIVFKRR